MFKIEIKADYMKTLDKTQYQGKECFHLYTYLQNEDFNGNIVIVLITVQ